MLDQFTSLYRLVGGEDATATETGSCGGGEYNRMMMSMDEALHSSLINANTNRGAINPSLGVYDTADIVNTSV